MMRRVTVIRLIGTTAVLVAGTALHLVGAAPASAAPGLTFEPAVSPLDSVGVKEAAAQCPAGTRVVGGGGFIEGGGRSVHFQRLQASGSLDTYFATATEISGGYLGNWRVHAYAICADQPAGLEYVAFHTSADSSSFRSATATCTGGRKVIGLGARTDNGAGQVVIDDMAPNGTLTSVTVTAYEDDTGYAGNWSLWAHAVCADPLPGLEFRTATSTPVDSDDNVIGVACPVGKQVHGVGAKMTGAVGEAFHAGIYPAADLQSATAISLEDHNLYANNWSNSVFAICAS